MRNPELVRLIEYMTDLGAHVGDELKSVLIGSIIDIWHADDLNPGVLSRHPCDRRGFFTARASMRAPVPKHIRLTFDVVGKNRFPTGLQRFGSSTRRRCHRRFVRASAGGCQDRKCNKLNRKASHHVESNPRGGRNNSNPENPLSLPMSPKREHPRADAPRDAPLIILSSRQGKSCWTVGPGHY
jgi:hypothetical protein